MNKLIVPKYCNANSILIVNSTGKLGKLYCPFRVQSIRKSPYFKPGTLLWVDEVVSNEENELIYFIFGKGFQHSSFVLKVSF